METYRKKQRQKKYYYFMRFSDLVFSSPLVPSKSKKNIYIYLYKRKYFVKVNIDGSALKKYTN